MAKLAERLTNMKIELIKKSQYESKEKELEEKISPRIADGFAIVQDTETYDLDFLANYCGFKVEVLVKKDVPEGEMPTKAYKITW